MAVTRDGVQNGPEPGKIVVIREDVHVRERIEWRDAEYQIHGNIIFHAGGELVVENATVSLMCTYTREFRYQWEGGKLVTRNVTIGGATKDDIVYQTYFEIQNGTWESEDTTIRYSSGVTMGWQGHPVKFHATRLRSGPHPDSIIMCRAAADVVLKDSEFDISLAVSANDGGQGRLDLPVNEPITRVFDSSNVPGVKYRLELVNTKVSLWWVFFSGIYHGGPPTEIVLGHCPRLIPSVLADNLQGTLSLPAPWPAQPTAVSDLTIGNLTLKSVGQPVHTWCWGLYLSGEKTDVLLRGQTFICELFLSDGKLVVEGDTGTYNSWNSCTTVEVGQRNVMGLRPDENIRAAVATQGRRTCDAQCRPRSLCQRRRDRRPNHRSHRWPHPHRARALRTTQAPDQRQRYHHLEGPGRTRHTGTYRERRGDYGGAPELRNAVIS